MRIPLLVGALVLALAVGCGSGEGEPPAVGDETPTVTAPAIDPEQLLEGNGTVLDDGGGPELCLGGVAESYPPQCGGIPLVGWDWDAVEGEESASGTTWGDFHVVGTYDGEIFTVTEVGPFDPPRSTMAATVTSRRCAQSLRAAGWRRTPTGPATRRSAPAPTIAQGLPGYVALWVDYAEDLPPEELDERMMAGDPVLQIMNVVVTEDAAGAEAAIREAWGGPLCVTRARGPHRGRARGHPGGGRAVHRGRARARDDLVAGRATSAWPPRSASSSTRAARARPRSTSATARAW